MKFSLVAAKSKEFQTIFYSCRQITHKCVLNCLAHVWIYKHLITFSDNSVLKNKSMPQFSSYILRFFSPKLSGYKFG